VIPFGCSVREFTLRGGPDLMIPRSSNEHPPIDESRSIQTWRSRQQFRESAYWRGARRGGAAASWGCLKHPKIKLRPHQIELARYLTGHRAVLATHSTGSGKSLLAAAAMRCLLAKRIVSHVAVIARKSALNQFHDALHEWDPSLSDATLSVTTVQGFFSSVAPRHPPESTFLVVDEAHKFTNAQAVRTKELLQYGSKAKRLLLLTATPYVNRPADLLPLIAMLRGTTEVMSEKEFAEVLKSPARLRRLVNGIIHLYIIDKAKDPNYPKLLERDISVRMSPSTWREYRKQEKQPAPFFVNLRRLSLGFSECEKCRWLLENVPKWINRGEGKIVIYTAYLETGADKIRKLLKSVGVNTLVVDGSTSANNRRRAALIFNRTKQEDEALLKQQDLKDLVQVGDEAKTGTRCGVGNVLAVRLSTEHKGKDGKPHYSYRYQNPSGKGKVTDADREYIESLVIPPAWTPAEACKEHAKLAWVAKDRKGHWQYRYSEDWRVQQEYRKVLALKALDSKFWRRFNATVEGALSRNLGSWTQHKQLALAAKLLQTCHFRAGTRDDDEDDEADHDEAELKDEIADKNPKPKKRLAGSNSSVRQSDAQLRPSVDYNVNRGLSLAVPAALTAEMSGALKHTAVDNGRPLISGHASFVGRTAGSVKLNQAKTLKNDVAKAAKKGMAKDVKRVPHYGLMTLQKRHVKQVGRGAYRRVKIEFVGKSGKVNRCEFLFDSMLGSAVWSLRERAPNLKSPIFDLARATDLRSFLASIRPGLRPKDFRTYFANYKLLDYLRGLPTPPVEMTGRQRSKALLEAVRTVSTALNNTPKVARSSYVFSGIDVLYLADPTRFQGVLSSLPENADTADVLAKFIRLFDENVIDWRAMLRFYKETKGLADFVGPAQVLLITDAGSESIDLAGTRHIVFLDQPWNPALESQIIGRGQRFGSHKRLPKAEQNLTVWRLYLDNPQGKPAIDRYVTNIIKEKRDEETHIYKLLQRATTPLPP
jgi:DNA topoisomerase IB